MNIDVGLNYWWNKSNDQKRVIDDQKKVILLHEQTIKELEKRIEELEDFKFRYESVSK